MFRTDLLSIIRSLYALFTTAAICHTSYVDCLPAVNKTSMTNSVAEKTVLRLLMMDSKSVGNMSNCLPI